MKKINNILLPCFMVLFASCADEFIDLAPPASLTDDAYYTQAEHFLTGSNKFYTNLVPWTSLGETLDHGSDLIGYREPGGMQDYGRGENIAPVTDAFYSNAYVAIRDMNLLLKRAQAYKGNPSDIAQYVAATKFHRAYQYFYLVQRFGGVPLVTTPLDVNSSILYGPRSSRYEVVAQVLKDLDDAIAGLPTEQQIPVADKGKISKWAAMAYKAEVLLHEATWMKYVGTTTDGDGVTKGAGSKGYDPSKINSYLQEVVTLTKTVMDQGGYALWNYNNVLNNMNKEVSDNMY